MKTFFKVVQAAVVGVIIVSALFVIGALIPVDGLYDIRVVMSGSMEPAIQTGSVVAYAERETYSEDDIIVFAGSEANSVPVTHRIVEVESDDGETVFVTQGDANEDPDHRRVREEQILGRVFLSVPYAGYLTAFLRTELGFFLLIAIPAILLIFSSIREMISKDKVRKDT